MQKLKLIFRYLKYLHQCKTKYDIHSPFLFDLITQVFEDKKQYPEYTIVEDLKKELLQNTEVISVTDLGAGSTIDRSNEHAISRIAKNASKSKKIGRLMFRLSRYFQPENILELGTSLGLSSMYMALGSPSSNIITIEGCPNISKIATANFQKLEMSQINQETGNFNDKLTDVLKKFNNLNLAFIDGNHQFEPTIRYFEQCLVKSNADSIFIFDDIHWSEGMEEAWENIIAHPDVSLSIDIFYMGIIFFRKELTKQHFVIRF